MVGMPMCVFAVYFLAMLVIPAIDILNGSCVRLYKGNYDAATVYDADPVAVARRFEAAGVERIHIVDLDAARGKGDSNRDVIRRVREAISVAIEVGWEQSGEAKAVNVRFATSRMGR